MKTIIIIVFCSGIAIFDIKTYRVPDISLILFLGLIIFIEGKLPFIAIKTRLFVSFAVFLLFIAIWYFSRAMGLGDVKYATVLGYMLGLDHILPALIITAFLSITVYIAGILLLKWSKSTKVPFAPFLSAGAIISVIGGLI